MENRNNVTEFVLLGLTQNPKLQKVVSVVFLVIYIISVVGNMFIMVTIIVSPLRSSPMYFFLAYLSFIDACYSSVNTPKLIFDSLHERKTILFNGCMTQIFGEHFLGSAEAILLTVMAYDRYVAICKPLHYTSIMNWRVRYAMVSACYAGAFLHSFVQGLLIINLPFCGPNEIDHYFCDVYPLLTLACTDTYRVGILEIILASATFNEVSRLMIILTSYVCIIITVLKMPSTGGRHKAFSTCASHLTAITIFHGSILFLYCVPNSKSSWLMVKVASVFYSMVIPMLNPLIYSLRNKDVKAAVRKLINTNLICQLMINVK
ncbi:unnamed protein product [Rangifer tarandus platyrhynchus]|uniref:Olfactory receptor n=1 Tax=Rangifer tarandus platyrhynchus TaxID=3082113 RepID=A0ABN8XZ46_RANTA|nr:unnamed protein product [Rangifer tarandus platyrhynchus]